MFKIFMRMHGWLVLVPLVVGILIFLVAQMIAAEASALGDDGVDATATIIGAREFDRLSSSTRLPETEYYLRFHFPIGGGRLHYGEVKVSRDLYERVQYGTNLPIRYLPSDPDTHEIEAGATSENAFYAGLVALFFLALGLLGLFFVVRQMLRAVAARDRGITGEAQVDSVVLNRGASHLLFHYLDQDGNRHDGRSMSGYPKRLSGVADGDVIAVRYDPRRPQRAFWERDLGL